MTLRFGRLHFTGSDRITIVREVVFQLTFQNGHSVADINDTGASLAQKQPISLSFLNLMAYLRVCVLDIKS